MTDLTGFLLKHYLGNKIKDKLGIIYSLVDTSQVSMKFQSKIVKKRSKLRDLSSDGRTLN
jgi:hypothetical protein